MVDVLPFHHWSSAGELSDRIVSLGTKSDKPILLEEVGYPSTGNHDEANQAQMLKEAIETTLQSGIAGWLVWASFDFTPPTGQPASVEYSFGLWHADLSNGCARRLAAGSHTLSRYSSFAIIHR